MWLSARGYLRGYGGAALTAAAALALRVAVEPILGRHSPYLVFTLAPMFAARFWGRGPGYAATGLSALAGALLVHEPHPEMGAACLAAFVFVGLLISHYTGGLGEALGAAARAQESLRRQSELVDLSHDAVITMDAERRITGWNAGAAELYGWSRAEAEGKLLHDLLRTGGAVASDVIDEILRRDGRWDGALEQTARDGRRLHVESRQVLTGDGVLAISRDVTEKVRAEQELRASSLRLALAQKAGRSGTFDWNMETGARLWSGELLDLYGLPREASGVELPEWIDCVVPEDRKAARAAIAHARRSGLFELEFRIRRRNTGEVRWMYCRADVLFSPDHNPVRMIGINVDVTERRQAEERQRISEERFAKVFALNPAANALARVADGLLLDVNEAWEHLFGYRRDEVIGRTATELNLWPSPENRAAWVAELTEKGRIRGVEQTVVAKSGARVATLASGELLTIGGEQMFLSAWLDLSRRKRVEEALRESEARYRAVVDQASDAIFLHDRDGRFVDVNRCACETLGYTREELLSMTVPDTETDLDVPAARSTWDAIRPGEPVTVYGRHRRKDGSSFPVEVRLAVCFVAGERLLLALVRDITERRRMETALRESESRYRALFESMQEGYAVAEVICDGAGKPVDWRYLNVNPAFETMFQRTREQLIDRTFRNVYPEEPWEYWVAQLGAVALTGAPARLENSTRGRHIEAIAYSPHPGQFAAIFTDMTVRRETEEQLRNAQKLESVGLLAGGVAHDFNNLLTVIMGSASAAIEECPSCEYSRDILSAAQRAADLTKQLLAYAGKAQFVVKVLDLNQLVSKAAQLLAASAPKRVALEFHLEPAIPSIEEDPSRVEQILMNLVINAGEAVPPKTDGVVRIVTGSAEIAEPRRARSGEIAPGRYVWLEVSDNGVGMDQKTIARVFDPFFSTKFTGRGLGLAAVDGIVRSSKGFIEVHSAPGEGTTFRVFLPASTRAAEAAPAAPPVETRAPAAAPLVLVVDDEEMVRKLAAAMLRRHGYRVLEAADGKDALRVLENAPQLPALVFVDLAMPVMGGDELAPVLASRYPDLRIVVTSGFPEEDARKGVAPGVVHGFLQKPYTAMGLTRIVAEVLGTADDGQQAR